MIKYEPMAVIREGLETLFVLQQKVFQQEDEACRNIFI